VHAGELVTIVGPNGAGKSTLLRLLAGELEAHGGTVSLFGTPLSQLKPLAQARKRAVLPQQSRIEFGFRVRDIVATGRSPWRGHPDAADDEHHITTALEDVDATLLAERTFVTLSGGETSRVTLARVLAQATPLLLLDEPTAALDPHHQAIVLDVARRRAREGAAVVAVLHDLNAVATYSDRVVLLRDGAIVASGDPNDVLTAPQLSDVYGCPIEVVSVPGRRRPVILTAEPLQS
jgi:iron complex transport system ATP-binding protein